MNYRKTGRLMIWGRKDFPLVMDNQAQEKIGLDSKCFFDTNSLRYDSMLKNVLLLDLETSNKVREIQDDADQKILELVKKNYEKASVITKENLKGAWGND